MGLFKDCGCGCNGKKQEDKFIISIISGLTFFVIANPETFRLVRRVLGPSIATPNGCPSTFGLVVHTIVFTLIVWAMMNVKKEGGKKKSGCGCDGKRGTKVVHSVEPDTDLDEPVLELEPQGLNSEGTLY
ncbi:hypothetical protein MPWG_00099 [Micromonas pusilla virus PL1]|jgi:hypothetical protein|nr:hypothetical protein MPWG_00099 [Micromonas pusilla virus PL1]